MTDHARQIGASKAGRRFIAQMRFYNAGDFERLRQFMHRGYDDIVLMSNPVERRLLDLKITRRLHGRLKVDRLEMQSPCSLFLTWQPPLPSQQNGIISGYTILLAALQDGSRHVYNLPATASSHHFEGL